MPLDPASPSVIFVRTLLGENPTEDQLEALDPGWAEFVQAAQEVTPVNRRTALLLARSGLTDTDRLFEVLPSWLGNFVRAEARATQTPPDLAGPLSLAVLATACGGWPTGTSPRPGPGASCWTCMIAVWLTTPTRFTGRTASAQTGAGARPICSAGSRTVEAAKSW
jgi:hypothetical protein